MSADDDKSGNGAAVTLATIGGGALLLWLLFGGKLGGLGGLVGGQRGSEHATPPVAARRPVVRTRANDRIEVDGVIADLATLLVIARDAGSVELHTSGDARAGWVSKVYYALVDAGVEVLRGAEISSPPVRFAEK